MPQLLKPVCPAACAPQKRSRHNGEPTRYNEREAAAMESPHATMREQCPLATTREKPLHRNEDSVQPKKKKFLKKMRGFGFVVVIWRQKNIYLWADTGRERECIRGNGMPPAPPREGTLEENGQEDLCFIHQSNLPVPLQSSIGPTSYISLTKSTSLLGQFRFHTKDMHADTQSFDLKSPVNG